MSSDWEEILFARYRQGWQLSQNTGKEVFRILQFTPPSIGRILIAEVIAEQFTNIQAFPATLEEFAIFSQTTFPRKIAIKLGSLSQEQADNWIVKILGLKLDAEIPENLRIKEYFYRKSLKSFELFFLFSREEDGFFISTFQCLPGIKSFEIGRFRDKLTGELLSEPVILPGNQEGVFLVEFTDKVSWDNRLIEVSLIQ